MYCALVYKDTWDDKLVNLNQQISFILSQNNEYRFS